MEETTAPVQPDSAIAPQEKPRTSWVAIASLVVVALLIAGGAIYLKSAMPEPTVVTPEALQEQSDSTEPEAIGADLEAQSPDQFDAEFDQAMAELDASLQ